MTACIHCGTASQFLTYDSLGLCHHCSAEHAPVIAAAIQGIAAATERRTRARRVEDQLAAISQSMDHCRTLQSYSGLSFQGIDAAALMAELEQVRTDTIEQSVRDHWFEARERARDATTPNAMSRPYARAIERLQALKDIVDDASVIEKAVIVLRAERDALVFEDFVRQARLAEQQGRAGRARDLYIEAVFWLRNDSTPDAYQADRIAQAEEQIERLGGRPSAGRTGML
ncbi:hypothetical protein [Phreatobacter sp.]|uniref:hypothetical protein n=1 Tax=Phreatobacter sp. TaxID=1966341 RepID=UPI003F719D36